MTTQTSQPSVAPTAGGSGYATLPIARMQVGATLRSPIFEDSDARDVLLLASGTTITEDLLERLHRRGVKRVRVAEGDVEGLFGGAGPGRGACRSAREFADDAAEHSGPGRRTPDSFLNRVVRHGATSYDRRQADEFARTYQDSVDQLESLFQALEEGETGDHSSIAAVSNAALLRIAEDLDLFIALGLAPAVDKYPCRHSLQTAMLAMSIGTMMGLRSQELTELGVGCLVHDAGMLHVNPKIVAAERALSPIEFLEITKHPTITFDMMRDLRDVPPAACMVAYQIHERCDGSGYPRKRRRGHIHPLARVASVADVFMALISPRPHRPGMLPYHAMEKLIRGTREGKFDSEAVRAFLHAVSLFPIGSYVQVSDGRIGQVVRANGENFTRPVVELRRPGAPADPEVVDFAEWPELTIVRPLPGLPLTAP